MESPNIKTNSIVEPTIYAYTTPGVPVHDGWLKIGYTEHPPVENRIKEQVGTADIEFNVEWSIPARRTDGSHKNFSDKDFHRFLDSHNVQHGSTSNSNAKEWFKIDATKALMYLIDFAAGKDPEVAKKCDYDLRDEQNDAVTKTLAYFKNGGDRFLWNAKPRFGKTLTAYDLIRRMKCKSTLVISNRPSIANSWAEDFNKFIAWRGELCFISDTDSLRNVSGVKTRREYVDSHNSRTKGFVAFESLQGLKGSMYFGGSIPKLEWMAKNYEDESGVQRSGIKFDLLIVDESQEGVDTERTDLVLSNIDRKHTLYLSGTPYKALAEERFSSDQTFSWTYADEQERKNTWDGDSYNPYEELPKLTMYTYRLSDMICDRLRQGFELPDGGTAEYAFDLSEFFATNANGTLKYEEEVKKFLHALTTQEKYPFSTPALRDELSHTLWLLNRVESVKALARLLKNDPIFQDYEIVIAAGDGRLEEVDSANVKAYNKVKDAIKNHHKTITLSVGQLTVGVTIPEWSAVLMLCNLNSASLYMQAAFRAQNPCIQLMGGNECLRKENAYVFDFDPVRTLVIFDEFASKLSPATATGRGTGEERQENIRRLLNFFPVIGEDDQGRMVELDATKVLTIPRHLKSQEVVRSGFRSNFLFQNIANVFGASGIVAEIIDKLIPAPKETKTSTEPGGESTKTQITKLVKERESTDERATKKVEELFGEKIYDNQIAPEITPKISEIADSSSDVSGKVKAVNELVQDTAIQKIVNPITANYRVSAKFKKQLEKEVSNDIEKALEKPMAECMKRHDTAKEEYEQRRNTAETQEELDHAEASFTEMVGQALNHFVQETMEIVKEKTGTLPKELVTRMEKRALEDEQKSIEDSVRDHLRGFSRTVPSFIMAYGLDEALTLENIDTRVEPEVFLEMTGITVEDFQFLRDGGDFQNSETGKVEHFDGDLFDGIVFNDSVEEFMILREKLRNYFAEDQEEDIFDYIPPQKTNQIFTPRSQVKLMVDLLEKENPHCFDDPNKTFADLYMKSGLFITEIVKRLFRSDGLKNAYPDPDARIRHILEKQVYGMAPTRIIYLIATNYILGFDDRLKINTRNFAQVDTVKAVKDGTLGGLVDQCFSSESGTVNVS